MPFGGGKFGAAQLRLFGNQTSGLLDISRHKNGERHFKVLHNTLVERRKLLRALLGKLKLAFDLLGRQLGEVLIDDVADVLEVNAERDDLHGAAALPFVK